MNNFDVSPKASHTQLSTNCQPTSSIPGPQGAVKGIKSIAPNFGLWEAVLSCEYDWVYPKLQQPNNETIDSGIPTISVPANASNLSRKSLVDSGSLKYIPTT